MKWLYSYAQTVYDSPSGALELGTFTKNETTPSDPIKHPAHKDVPILGLVEIKPIGVRYVNVFEEGGVEFEDEITQQEYEALGAKDAGAPTKRGG